MKHKFDIVGGFQYILTQMNLHIIRVPQIHESLRKLNGFQYSTFFPMLIQCNITRQGCSLQRSLCYWTVRWVLQVVTFPNYSLGWEVPVLHFHRIVRQRVAREIQSVCSSVICKIDHCNTLLRRKLGSYSERGLRQRSLLLLTSNHFIGQCTIKLT